MVLQHGGHGVQRLQRVQVFAQRYKRRQLRRRRGRKSALFKFPDHTFLPNLVEFVDSHRPIGELLRPHPPSRR